MVAWTLPAMLLQSVLLLLPGRGKERFARKYWRGMAWILGLRLRVLGKIAAARPVLFVANHSSWVDVLALGGVLPGCFIAKSEVAGWPVMGWIARLGRTIFVSRSRDTVAREAAVLQGRLAQGDNIVLFPEGTTSDGNRVLPFAPAFLALAFGAVAPTVQPVTIVYDELDGLPVRRGDRPDIAWYGDMTLGPHLWRLLRRGNFRASIVLGTPVPAGSYKNRKALSQALEAQIAASAADLRQGRWADMEASREFS